MNYPRRRNKPSLLLVLGLLVSLAVVVTAGVQASANAAPEQSASIDSVQGKFLR